MVPRGTFAAGNSFLQDDILYHLTLFRADDGYKAYFECTEYGPDENAEPVIHSNGTIVLHAARRLAETHYGQLHGLFARKLAAHSLAARQQEAAMQCSK